MYACVATFFCSLFLKQPLLFDRFNFIVIASFLQRLHFFFRCIEHNPLHIGSLYVCMYVCMYACMYVCTHVCVYVCAVLSAFTSSSASLTITLFISALCMYACMYVCMHVCMHACMYVCIYVCMASQCCHRVSTASQSAAAEINTLDLFCPNIV